MRQKSLTVKTSLPSLVPSAHYGTFGSKHRSGQLQHSFLFVPNKDKSLSALLWHRIPVRQRACGAVNRKLSWAGWTVVPLRYVLILIDVNDHVVF